MKPVTFPHVVETCNVADLFYSLKSQCADGEFLCS